MPQELLDHSLGIVRSWVEPAFHCNCQGARSHFGDHLRPSVGEGDRPGGISRAREEAALSLGSSAQCLPPVKVDR